MAHAQSIEERVSYLEGQQFGERMKRIETSIQHLNTTFNQRITETNQRITALDEKMDRRFETVDQRFTAMDEKIDRRFESMNRRFESFDKKFKWVLGTIMASWITILIGIISLIGIIKKL
ncbi:MAG: hypothetical protein PF545_02270 [Elusimicrobia bacterium]|jgi:DNA anti-recombination protein RmuC|nr:hypothetical protein [Elusimicrobiota bacterium]